MKSFKEILKEEDKITEEVERKDIQTVLKGKKIKYDKETAFTIGGNTEIIYSLKMAKLWLSGLAKIIR